MTRTPCDGIVYHATESCPNCGSPYELRATYSKDGPVKAGLYYICMRCREYRHDDVVLVGDPIHVLWQLTTRQVTYK